VAFFDDNLVAFFNYILQRKHKGEVIKIMADVFNAVALMIKNE
jgi:hypothetical protein